MKGVLSVSDSEQRYVFQVLISSCKLFIVVPSFSFYHIPLISFFRHVLGGTFYIGWLPGQGVGTR